MKKPIFAAALFAMCALLMPAVNADVVDDFDTGATGLGTVNPANGGWSSKWQENSNQQDLYTNVAGNGVGGSNGVALDVFTAERNYNTVNQTGVTAAAVLGSSLLLSADFQFGHDGENLMNQNAPFIGLHLSTTGDWFSGTNHSFSIARRGPNGQVVGVVDPTTSIAGWYNTELFGLPAGGAEGTSDWFRMEALLTDNGATYDAVYTLYNASGAVQYTSATHNTGYASGTTLYGGFSTSWNNAPIGSINSVNGVTEVNIDNFSFTATSIPEPSAGIVGITLLGLLTSRRRRS